MHIGNIRTAIFNWLWARHTGGAFLLRVEDTDKERSTEEAVGLLLKEMAWLGLDFDEEPVYQSTKRERHLEVAEELLSKGLAYRDDFGKPEMGEATVFRMPGKDITLEDAVKGSITKKAEDMKDLVIVRSDGNPVFHLANIVDDLDSGVTWIMRGDDHVDNTLRHLAVYEALGATPPRYAHLPMIVNKDGKPYSKRDGNAYVGQFREDGILPETMFNFLALLGWSPGDDRELMTREELVAAFDVERIRSAPSQMDLKKLEWLNGETMRSLPADDFEARCREALGENGGVENAPAVIELYRERLKRFSDLPTQAGYLFSDAYEYDPKTTRKKFQKDGVPEAVTAFAGVVEGLGAEASLHDAMESFCGEREMGMGALMGAVRLSLSGQGGGPGLFDVMELLGREESVRRMRRAVGDLAG